MAVVSILHTVTNASSVYRRFAGALIAPAASAKVAQEKVSKADRAAVTAGDFTVAPALPPTIEDRDQANFELSIHGFLGVVLVGPIQNSPIQMPFKASSLVSAQAWGTGGGAITALDLPTIELKNDDVYELTHVQFLADNTGNDVLLLFRP